jgi:small subunit ribosomal protein S16
MQRTGRKGHAMFRVVVQESRLTPTSGKVVARLGSYDPHGKAIILDKEKASFYLDHGAQPSDRVARLLKAEGVKLPGWVKLEANKERTVRNADKRRSTRPDEPVAEEAPAEEPAEETAPAETPEEPAAEPAPAEEAPAAPEEAPAEEPAPEEPAEPEAPAEEPAEPEAPAEEDKAA